MSIATIEWQAKRAHRTRNILKVEMMDKQMAHLMIPNVQPYEYLVNHTLWHQIETEHCLLLKTK